MNMPCCLFQYSVVSEMNFLFSFSNAYLGSGARDLSKVAVLPLFQVGKLSTGDSLDMSPHDETAILSNEATVKDMEVHAFGWEFSL